MNEPTIFEGGLSVDDRGKLSFVSGLDLHIKRFYIVSNHKSHFVRAWHGHLKEAKLVSAIQGSALVGAVKLEEGSIPKKFILSSDKPSLLYIPPGYANGFMNLTKDTKLLFLSTSTPEESKLDDIRFSFQTWNIWQIEER